MIEEAVSFYHDNLPNPTIVDEGGNPNAYLYLRMIVQTQL